ncbi:polysaccharide deacetylase family protein [Terrilactibacillus sp. BCM23-1]|uniref:Polysaccharide deacetylase family protein n=1 Tax=Terrilactibacillus tamarindi TaxID=2599694 RepID=A0A6N8CRC3_9BACI|nr:polysaccharide deacetylase family protein [Terrilactibacillus tamarindi]MTT32230.1 polysaccharide deacetylase family protein [Terrilactibacillus tamarindi]
MKKKWYISIFCLFTIVIFGSMLVFFFPKLNETSIKTNETNAKQTALYQQITSYRSKISEKPQDARIDPVWKAIPGYNGLTVDIRKSYQKMKKNNKFDPKKLVYKEVPPKKHLQDLSPAPIYRGNQKKPMVAFLINVSWGNEYIPQMLKVLHHHHIHATFFLDGKWVEDNSELALMIREGGHQIGSHAYGHPDLNKMTKSDVSTSLKKANRVIEATLDVKPRLMAPPSGSFNQQTVNVSHQLGMRTILWTADTVDWKHPDTTSMVMRVISRTENGSMILMHPTKESSRGLSKMIKGIENKGYRFGTVSDMLSEERVVPKLEK